MSAGCLLYPRKADICSALADVCYGPRRPPRIVRDAVGGGEQMRRYEGVGKDLMVV
jgi:hypothetical protein